MAPRRKKTEDAEPKLSLQKALDFIKVAQTDKPNDMASRTHCRLAQGYAVAFDGVLAAGHPIEEEFTTCPHTYRLLDAIKRCKKAVSITQLDGDNLVIKSGRFRAVIKCLNPAAIPYVAPDPRVGSLTPKLKEGFAVLNPIVSGTGVTVVEASLLLNNASMVATDRIVMVEFWHGINLPNGLAIPKEAINAIVKCPLEPVGIGVSDRTVTFWYENGAWLRTQLYGEKWPDVSRVLNVGDYTKATTTPPALWEAVDIVSPFAVNDLIVTDEKGLVAGEATYELEGVPANVGYGAKHLAKIKDMAKRIDFVGEAGITFFFGDDIRGAIAQRVKDT